MAAFVERVFSSGAPSDPGGNIQFPVEMPATVLAGDYLVAFVSQTQNIGSSGFTKVTTSNPGSGRRMTSSYKVADGTEGGTTKNFPYWDPARTAATDFVAVVFQFRFGGTATVGIGAWGGTPTGAPPAQISDDLAAATPPGAISCFAINVIGITGNDTLDSCTWGGDADVVDDGIENWDVSGAFSNHAICAAHIEYTDDPSAVTADVSNGVSDSISLTGMSVLLDGISLDEAPVEGGSELDLRLTRMVGDSLPYQVHTGMLGLGRRRER